MADTTADKTAGIVGWLQARPGATDREIAAEMQKQNISVADMATAVGAKSPGEIAAIQSRYDAASKDNSIVDYLSTPDLADTDIVKKMQAEGWTNADIAKMTGMDESQVAARARTAGALNDLSSNYDLLKNNYDTLNTNYANMQSQLATLQNAYDQLNGQLAGGNNIVNGGVNVDDGSTLQNAGLGTTGVVYGPDGTSYSSAAAAIRAGVTNYSYTKPVLNQQGGLINNANSLNRGFMSPASRTGNANPGANLSGTNQQLFNLGGPMASLPGNVNNPFAG